MNEIKTNVLFKNDENLSGKYLWKYMDLHKFLSFIISKSLHLTRFDKFEDKREGIPISNLFLIDSKKQADNDLKEIAPGSSLSFMTIDSFPDRMNKIEETLKLIQRFNFASCWVIGDKNIESVAMWNLYSDSKSIAIRIKYDDFKNSINNFGYQSRHSIEEIICGPIKYANFQSTKALSEIPEELNDSVFIKDVSFEHEKEFRIIAKEKIREISPKLYKPNISNKFIDKEYNRLYNYPGIKLDLVDFDNYNFEVIHHPKANDWTKKNIEEIIEKFEIKFNVFNSNLELK